MRKRKDIERATEILLSAVVGNEARGDIQAAATCAMGATPLGWVLGWKKVGGEFQSMIDACNAIDAAAQRISHQHRKPLAQVPQASGTRSKDGTRGTRRKHE